MIAAAYRSLEPVAAQRLAELRARREQGAYLVDLARGVASRRIGRAFAGAVGVAMGGTAFLLAVVRFISRFDDDHLGVVSSLLLLAWPAALMAGAVARVVARGVLVAEAPTPAPGNPAEELARLEARDPLRNAIATAMRWERRAAALPLAALSLVAPLTIHWLVFLALSTQSVLAGGAWGHRLLDEFGWWVGLSAVLVGHAHIALLVAATRWACRLHRVSTDELRVAHRPWVKALLISFGIACVPGAVLFVIPPILVVLTGLLFVPFMYGATVRTLLTERQLLEATQPA
jgi:hypothetical protein